jgi:DNA-binding NtrC family response regulator
MRADWRSGLTPPQDLSRAGSGADPTGNAAILVVAGEPRVRQILKRALGSRCALLEVAQNLEAAEALRERCHFDLMIVDGHLAGRSSLQRRRGPQEEHIGPAVIFIAGHEAEATRGGTLDAPGAGEWVNPCRTGELLGAVRRRLAARQEGLSGDLKGGRPPAAVALDGMIGSSPAIREVSEVVARVAPTSSTILIEGETGVGKERVAQAIHKLSGRSGQFVPLNCASISPELLESELFGHIRGAFTGAHASREGLFTSAHQGTLFLDEVSELPLSMQTQLLRVLEERTVRPVGADREIAVNTRVIAATNRRLATQVRSGRFRQDLYYRLNVLTLTVPPLRERPEDIPVLADHFVETLAREIGLPALRLTGMDVRRLQRYPWPGNVRELRNVIERSLLLGKLPSECFHPEDHETSTDRPSGFPASWSLEEVERHHILRVLDSVGGNKSEAARRLRVSRKTLDRRLRTWSLTTDEDA